MGTRTSSRMRKQPEEYSVTRIQQGRNQSSRRTTHQTPLLLRPARSTSRRSETVNQNRSLNVEISFVVIRPNENKMSDGGQGRASLGVKGWKSFRRGAYSGPPFAPSPG